MIYLSQKDYDDWIERMYNDCKKVTGFGEEEAEYVYYPTIISNPELEFGICRFNSTTRNSPDKTVIRKGDFILCKLDFCMDFRIINIRNGKTGWSRKSVWECNFIGKVALAIAWSRYCKCEIPRLRQYVTLDNFKNIGNGTILEYDGDSCFERVVFIGADPEVPNEMILKVKYCHGAEKLISWKLIEYDSKAPIGRFYIKD